MPLKRTKKRANPIFFLKNDEVKIIQDDVAEFRKAIPDKDNHDIEVGWPRIFLKISRTYAI